MLYSLVCTLDYGRNGPSHPSEEGEWMSLRMSTLRPSEASPPFYNKTHKLGESVGTWNSIQISLGNSSFWKGYQL